MKNLPRKDKPSLLFETTCKKRQAKLLSFPTLAKTLNPFGMFEIMEDAKDSGFKIRKTKESAGLRNTLL